MLELSESKVYEFEGFRLDAKSHRLFRGDSGELVPLTPKAVELLIVLVQNKGQVVTKDQLLDAVWNNSFVEEANLSQTIFVLRKALGENTKVPRFILTAPNRGYSFIATVKTINGEDAILDESFLLDIPHSFEDQRSHSEVRKPGGPISESIRSLAVLPLKNLTGDPANEYLSDGMTESLTVSLSRIEGLAVIAQTSSFTYKNKEIDFAEVGSKLNVETVMIGSVQKEEQALRVNVRLIKVLDGRILWANEFVRPAKEIFALQDDITRYVILKINPTVDDQAVTNFERRYTNNPDVYELYLKGRYFWLRRTNDDVSKGLRLFEQAIALDPNYAPAYVGLSDSYIVQSNLYYISPALGFPRAQAAVMKALEIDERYGDAHCSLARIKIDFEWDWEGAEVEFKRALELNPNHAQSYHWYAKFLVLLGRFDESIRKFERAKELDPLSLSVKADSSFPYFATHQYEQALSILKEALEMEPNRPGTLSRMGENYLCLGKTSEALTVFQKALELDDSCDAMADVAYTLAMTNQNGEANRLLNRLIERSKLIGTAYYEIARVYVGLNEYDEVFKWLEKAFESHSPGPQLLAIDPRFNNLRSDPRFQDLLQRVGLSRADAAKETVPFKATGGDQPPAPVKEINADDAILEKGLVSDSQPFEVPGSRSNVSNPSSKSLWLLVPLALLIVFGVYWFYPTSQHVSVREIKSIAVLPFEDLSVDQKEKYLGVSLADALANKFSGLKQITVRPTRTVLKYADSREDITKIGRELQVDAVLDGRIQHVGERIRVSVQLIRTSDGATIWTGNFDDQFTNFFAVQDSISQRVVQALALQIDEKERDRFNRRGTENAQAYQEYLFGRFFWNKRSANDLDRAIEHFKRAVELDPNFAQALAGLAETYAIYPFYAVNEDKEALPKARLAATRALEIDGELAEAHTALAYVQSQYDLNWNGAERSYLRSIELNPNHATTRQWYGEFLAFQARTDESLAQMQKAIELDPTSLSTNTAPALAYNVSKQFEKALEVTDKVLQMDANFAIALHYKARALFLMGKREEVFEIYRKLIAANSSSYFKADLGCLYGRAGRETEARKLLAELHITAKEKHVSPYYFAIVHLGLNEREKAFELLRKAVAEHDSNVIVLKVGTNFDSVRDDPQFIEILRSANF